MAVKFINSFTGTEMYIDESRVEEYKKAGHKPASKNAGTKPPKQEEPPVEETAQED